METTISTYLAQQIKTSLMGGTQTFTLSAGDREY
jgi:hypothetical protein